MKRRFVSCLFSLFFIFFSLSHYYGVNSNNSVSRELKILACDKTTNKLCTIYNLITRNMKKTTLTNKFVNQFSR